MCRLTFSHEQRERNYRIIGQSRPAVGSDEHSVASQIFQKEQCSDSFVTVSERMIFDYEVKKMSRSRLRGRIEWLTAKSLFDRAQYATELIAALYTK